jgi:hypothetical protein
MKGGTRSPLRFESINNLLQISFWEQLPALPVQVQPLSSQAQEPVQALPQVPAQVLAQVPVQALPQVPVQEPLPSSGIP